MPKENIIPLIMKGDHSPTNKHRIMRKKTSKHSRNRVAQPCIEIIKN